LCLKDLKIANLFRRHGVRVEALKPISEITEIWCPQSETSSQTSKSTKSQSTGITIGSIGLYVIFEFYLSEL